MDGTGRAAARRIVRLGTMFCIYVCFTGYFRSTYALALQTTLCVVLPVVLRVVIPVVIPVELGGKVEDGGMEYDVHLRPGVA